MTVKELILSSCSAQEDGHSYGANRSASVPAIRLHDLATTAQCQSFKTSSNNRNCLAVVPSVNGLGGSVWAAQEGKALVGIWAWQKDQQHMKLHLPERLSCLAISPNGVWVAGGSSNGQIYLWEVASGLLLVSWTAHYRPVTVLMFSHDSSELVSGSADTSVHVFLVSRVIDGSSDSTYLHSKPYGTLGDHALPITDIAVGKSADCAAGRCWTASEDGTVKMWSLAPPFDLLATFWLPPGVVGISLAVDPAERFLYVGARTGDIYLVPLYKRTTQMGQVVEALGGKEAGASPSHIGSPCIHVDSPITCISLSLAATHLLVGTNAGDIHIHSLPSHQHVKTVSAHRGPITHLSTMLSPPDLVASQRHTDDWPVMEIRNLERMRTRKLVRDSQDVGIRLQARTGTTHFCRRMPLRSSTLASGQKASTAPSTDHTASLHNECQRLRSALERAAVVNERMWNGVVDLHISENESQVTAT